MLKRECSGKRFRTKDEAEALPARLSDWQDKKNAEKKPYRLKFTVEKAREHPHLYNTELDFWDVFRRLCGTERFMYPAMERKDLLS